MRACERRKNPEEGLCSEANLSDIGTSCLDLRKNHTSSGLSTASVRCQSLPSRELSALSVASAAVILEIGEVGSVAEPSSSLMHVGLLDMIGASRHKTSSEVLYGSSASGSRLA